MRRPGDRILGATGAERVRSWNQWVRLTPGCLLICRRSWAPRLVPAIATLLGLGYPHSPVPCSSWGPAHSWGGVSQAQLGPTHLLHQTPNHPHPCLSSPTFRLGGRWKELLGSRRVTDPPAGHPLVHGIPSCWGLASGGDLKVSHL